MPDRTCKTCKHWDEKAHAAYPEFEAHRCNSKHVSWIACDMTRDGVMDSGGWPHVTGPDFGCIHWEAKP